MSNTSSLFAFEVRAETTINTPAEIVWQTLTDVDNYHVWSSMLHYQRGKVALGETLNLRLSLPETDYSFAPEVVALEPERVFAWRATTGFRGVFDGEHSFVLEPLANQQTRLINREIYSGLLAPIFKRLPMMQGAQAGFVAMNEEIKRHSERVFAL
jgi:hypothetical protein